MSTQMSKLLNNQQRGSKPRCHWITNGERDDVASRLTRLIEPWGQVRASDKWMPDGFDGTDEAELHKAKDLLTPSEREEIQSWWFTIVRGKGPNFDIASTCTVTVEGATNPGLLLLEAKAYDKELEKGPKVLNEKSSLENHNHIQRAIVGANVSLADGTGLEWKLSRETHYQMSNRFASACKLAELGYPVIHVYLGFLNAKEMRDKGTPLLSGQ
ncbi:MAG: hypothetical protein M3Y56_14600, partial [Armatimonadota bacterium]|nr:hypothetical protein [Armatimonadota bacterium]